MRRVLVFLFSFFWETLDGAHGLLCRGGIAPGWAVSVAASGVTRGLSGAGADLDLLDPGSRPKRLVAAS